MATRSDLVDRLPPGNRRAAWRCGLASQGLEPLSPTFFKWADGLALSAVRNLFDASRFQQYFIGGIYQSCDSVSCPMAVQVHRGAGRNNVSWGVVPLPDAMVGWVCCALGVAIFGSLHYLVETMPGGIPKISTLQALLRPTPDSKETDAYESCRRPEPCDLQQNYRRAFFCFPNAGKPEAAAPRKLVIEPWTGGATVPSACSRPKPGWG